MFFLVDAFTDTPFSGNPAGVCFLKEYPSDKKLQNFSFYHSWSNTAFLKRLSEDTFYIRWFAPLKEAPLCGHATLASAYVIFSNKLVPKNVISFEYKGGYLKAELNKNETITMTFPAKPIYECKNFPFSVKEILGIDDYIKVLKDDLIYFVVLKNAEAVKKVQPQLEAIKKIDARAVAITAQGDAPFDFTARYFAPRVGISEDPVCGSMHCRLTPFWSRELGKSELLAFQASKRSGILNVKFEGDNVKLTGRAIVVSKLTSLPDFASRELVEKP
ncbi:MAG: PhzF family phenazine biosynthesis protein [Holosporales bacterium]|jgi:PhzF family phenazine biosynthesis protein|nr:PhzF family phenazine biosynthesis protein [Holosporales bacterium]